jgi:acyl-CoA hydrolase
MELKVITPATAVTMRLIKSEDLNHHGTLFAGRTAEWFVESGFIAATSLLKPQNVVCLKIHGMYFTKPAKSGDVLKFSSKVVYAGKSSLTAYVHVEKNGSDILLVDGFITHLIWPSSIPEPSAFTLICASVSGTCFTHAIIFTV